jgi:hypothetical protein
LEEEKEQEEEEEEEEGVEENYLVTPLRRLQTHTRTPDTVS